MAVNETLYIKGDRNVEVTKRDITLGDVLSMECANAAVTAKLKTVKILKVPEGKSRFVVSILRVIELIHEVCPNVDVQNLGEADLIITYENQKTPNQFVHFVKTAFVVCLTFIGAAFSIMSFNNDVASTRLFAQIYEWVMGTKPSGFSVLELTYCIGLVVGILTFFNHFGKKRFSVDPTPMEVEMRLYETDIESTIVDTYARKEQEIDVGQTNNSGNYRS